jgi:hypothetical protein
MKILFSDVSGNYFEGHVTSTFTYQWTYITYVNKHHGNRVGFEDCFTAYFKWPAQRNSKHFNAEVLG